MSEFWDNIAKQRNERLRLEGSSEYVPPVVKVPKPRQQVNANKRGPAAVFDDHQCREIRAKYEAPGTVNALAQEYGVAPLTIRRAIARVGGTIRSKSESTRLAYFPDLTREHQAEIVRRYVAGESSTYLAREFKVGDVTVTKLVRAAGEHVRTVQEAVALREKRRREAS